MIIIFFLLGTTFLIGGAAAIVDGLPYMVLERGFTQVIIGTVVAGVGVVMMALAWVLVELRRIRASLANAAMAMSVASMVGTPATSDDARMRRTAPAAEQDMSTLPLGPAPAGALAGAGAGAALAVSQALAAQGAAATNTPETLDPVAGAVEDAPEERYVAATDDERRADTEREDVSETPPTLNPAPSIDPDALTAAEASAASPVEITWPVLHADRPTSEPLGDTDAVQDADLDSATSYPGKDDDRDQAENPAETEIDPPDLWTELAAPPSSASDIVDPLALELTPRPAREPDEFGLLRESLAGLGLGAEPTGRIEPSFADISSPALDSESRAERAENAVDEVTAAASWMAPASQDRAPWLDDETQPLQESNEREPQPATLWPTLDIADREAPLWPPRTRDAAIFEPQVPQPMAVEERPPLEAEPAPPVEAEAEPAAPLEQSEAGEPPAASEEGIVGAYQVGEAHFTIYADGSIQARTPDGDYSFTSMDELKIYLASEKSRLGV
ncbi:hypothetical protein IP69_06260 [Bosea sp. AAP35]|uniref:hypothetical protein n=1 Tax=Bosea sp. AAP35 TaxID=1523417 RepID=UPI0006B8AEFF|nr:hypothetical protein [Bosea sp. AAP35]KPF71525.1 hypothetical protein IP69_06260 [Bosea sp. AAP35]